MNISYLIGELEQLKEKHGDLVVTTKMWNEIWNEYLYESIEEVQVTVDQNRDGEKIVNLQW